MFAGQLHSVFRFEQVGLNILLKLFVHFACLEPVCPQKTSRSTYFVKCEPEYYSCIMFNKE